MSDELLDMERQGLDNVRRDWSERIREITGGVEDLKGKPFWTVASLAVASTLISACVDEARKRSERKGQKANRATPPPRPTYEEWLATKRGMQAIKPGPMPDAVVEPITIGEKFGRSSVIGHKVRDPVNAEFLSIRYIFGPGPTLFTLVNEREQRVVAEGTYERRAFPDRRLLVFEITSARTPGRENTEFEPEKIARMLRAYVEALFRREKARHPKYPGASPHEVVLIDARADYTAAEIEAELHRR